MSERNLDPDQRQQVDQLCSKAMILPECKWTSFLEQECPDDPAVRDEIADLLKRIAGGPDLVPVTHTPSDHLSQTQRFPENIGRYKIRRVIATGGMGTVYEAIQESPRRTVALKIIKRGFASRLNLRRFEYETQILGRLKHPGVAQIFEAGTHDDGSGPTPYFAMEYVQGAKTLIEYTAAKGLGTRDRLELFALICDAVHHGHQKGVIHRDLKPSNLLVDLSGQPKVIDFGVARSTNSDVTATTIQTDIGQIIGTLQYMSPEQFEADPHDIDTRSDVYSLGAILYELLCDKRPYEVSRTAIHEAARIVRETNPSRLSSINRTLRGDIETITLKALEKSREMRYRSAQELADDIRRYLRLEPITAHAPSITYQLRMFAQQHKTVFRATIAVALSACIGLTGVTFGLISTTIEKRRAERLFIAEGIARADAIRERDAAIRQAYVANIWAADAAILEHKVGRAKIYLANCSKALAGFEWSRLDAATDLSLAVLQKHSDDIRHAVVSNDGARIATVSDDNTVWLWDGASGTPLFEFTGHTDNVVYACFGTNNKILLTTSEDDTARLWDTETGATLAIFSGHTDDVDMGSFSPDGSMLITASRDNTARIWHSQTGLLIAVLSGHTAAVRDAWFSPCGMHVVTASDDGTARLWDVESGDEIFTLSGHSKHVRTARYSPDGKYIATASRDHSAQIWDATTGISIRTLNGHENVLRSAKFSSDGKQLLTASWDDTARIWDVSTGQQLLILAGHSGWVWTADFSSDDRFVVTASRDGTARTWSALDGSQLALLSGHDGWLNNACFTPDGERVITSSADGTARIWKTKDTADTTILSGHTDWVVSVAFSPDVSKVVSGSWDDTARVWDISSGTELLLLQGHDGDVFCATYSNDGTQIATASRDGTVRIWAASDGSLINTLHGHDDWVWSVCFSPDDEQILSSSRDGTARLWNPKTGSELGLIRGHSAGIRSAKFSNDGLQIVTASLDGTARIWDALHLEQIAILSGHTDIVRSAQFNSAGSEILTSSWDSEAWIWDANKFEPKTVLRGQVGPVLSASFNPTGNRVLTSYRDGSARIWNSRSGEELAVLRGHEDGVASSEFSPDGRLVATASWDHTIRIWHTTHYRDRYATILEAGQGGLQAATLIGELRERNSSWKEVANSVRSDGSLDQTVRSIALDLITVRAENERLELTEIESASR